MLELNPYMRLSADKLLQSPFFDDIRSPEKELPPPTRIRIPLDEEDVFDYSEEKFTNYGLEDLLNMLFLEVK